MASLSDYLDRLAALAAKATPGERRWYGNTSAKHVYLATVQRGREFIMRFVRWGMGSAQPQFRHRDLMVSLSALPAEIGPQYEVDYRRDFVGIAHPDAAIIAACDPETVAALVAVAKAAEAVTCCMGCGGDCGERPALFAALFTLAALAAQREAS